METGEWCKALSADSDGDGVLDGQETNGTWCYKGQASCTPGVSINDSRRLNALNPDYDGDGLRDGQELAGWMVGIWYERTMEKKINYSVTSDPKVNNSDTDALTDFEEFMNGSDPRALDTDGDRLNDTLEAQMHTNLTGIEGTPPRIENVSISVGLAWRGYSVCAPVVGCATLYTPDHLELHVVFDVNDPIGVDRVTLRVTKLSGEEARMFSLGGAFDHHFDEVFTFGLLEAVATGADINITAYDSNENGAWGQFHQDSIVEAVANAVVAYFTAIANVIAEAASALFHFLISMFQVTLGALVGLFYGLVQGWLIRSAAMLILGLDNGDLVSRSEYFVRALTFVFHAVRELEETFLTIETIEGVLEAIITAYSVGTIAVARETIKATGKLALPLALRAMLATISLATRVGDVVSEITEGGEAEAVESVLHIPTVEELIVDPLKQLVYDAIIRRVYAAALDLMDTYVPELVDLIQVIEHERVDDAMTEEAHAGALGFVSIMLVFYQHELYDLGLQSVQQSPLRETGVPHGQVFLLFDLFALVLAVESHYELKHRDSNALHPLVLLRLFLLVAMPMLETLGSMAALPVAVASVGGHIADETYAET